LPFVKVTPLEATYLVWLDFSALGKSSDEVTADLLKKEQLWVNKGTMYGANGEGFIRLNMACPRQLLVAGLEKIKKCFANK
jgi:cystathionine beta-lyase